MSYSRLSLYPAIIRNNRFFSDDIISLPPKIFAPSITASIAAKTSLYPFKLILSAFITISLDYSRFRRPAGITYSRGAEA